MTLRRRVAEKMGYRVVEIHDYMGVPVKRHELYVLLDPYGKPVCGWYSKPDSCWRHVPAFDTWEGLGMVLEWLGEKRGIYFEIVHLDDVADDMAWSIRDHTDGGYGTTVDTEGVNDFPKAICEFALEVVKE